MPCMGVSKGGETWPPPPPRPRGPFLLQWSVWRRAAHRAHHTAAAARPSCWGRRTTTTERRSIAYLVSRGLSEAQQQCCALSIDKYTKANALRAAVNQQAAAPASLAWWIEQTPPAQLSGKQRTRTTQFTYLPLNTTSHIHTRCHTQEPTMIYLVTSGLFQSFLKGAMVVTGEKPTR
jgi:hypothetical protein